MARVTTAPPDTEPTRLRRRTEDISSGPPFVAAIAIILASIAFLQIPYFGLIPGPAEDVVGLISIDGAQTHAVNGKLMLTTVSVVPELRVGGAVRGWLDPNFDVVPRAVLVAEDETEEEADQRVALQMTESQDRAAAAALSLLGFDVEITDVGARIAQVFTDGPARFVLETGDVIVGADSQEVTSPEDFEQVIERHAVGDEVVIDLWRRGKKMTVRSDTVARPGDPTDAIIGVLIEPFPLVKLPVSVKIDAKQIGGPSAGLMFALGIVDLLNGSDLTKGRAVAGTGEISVDGSVGAVGGVRQKVMGARARGASLFLVPLDELKEACAAAGDLPVYGVENLEDAVRVLSQGERDRTCARLPTTTPDR